MRIFKNRGDIYFSKFNKEKSAEQKILFTALTVIVIFTVCFVALLCVTNDFSAKKFFAPENISVTQNVTDEYTEELPEVSGKNNFLIMVHKDENLLVSSIVQVDMDNQSYKVSVLKAQTVVDGNKLSNIFAQSGVENVKNALTSFMGIDIDYYISLNYMNFREIFADFGSINYPVLNDIKYKDEKSAVTYSLKIKAGEQKIDAVHFINLIRYYTEVQDSTSQANELMLAVLSQQLCSENYEKRESLFKSLVTLAETNITIRDFSSAGDALMVIGNDRTAMSVYNASAEYDGNNIKESSLKKVKSYFVK